MDFIFARFIGPLIKRLLSLRLYAARNDFITFQYKFSIAVRARDFFSLPLYLSSLSPPLQPLLLITHARARERKLVYKELIDVPTRERAHRVYIYICTCALQRHRSRARGDEEEGGGRPAARSTHGALAYMTKFITSEACSVNLAERCAPHGSPISVLAHALRDAHVCI